jgi:23S rRNA (pseudouridine1915-N3)-methyltransferase
MKIEFWAIGKTKFGYLDEGISTYVKRLQKYHPISWEVIPDVRNGASLPSPLLQEREGQLVLKKLNPDDYLILLDEHGRQFTSLSFAQYLEGLLHLPARRLIFVVGGAWGFSDELLRRANALLSMSGLTFSHQMVRLIFLEQLYRAFTILRGEPYHNE